MADPTLTTQNQPDYNQKQFTELNPGVDAWFTGLNKTGNGNLTLKQASGPGNAGRDFAQQWINLGVDPNTTVQQVINSKKDPNFIQQLGIGNAYSYADLARNALRADPNFDPSNTDVINKFAAEIQKRGYTNKDTADISNLASNTSIQKAINQAKNPTQGKSAEELAKYNQNVNDVFQSVMGRAPTANELDFFSKEIAGGTSPYELEQALQTSPEYVQKQNDLQAQKNQQASDAALQALNTNLQQTQKQAFDRATPGIIASYMRAGRLNSSGLSSALAQAQKDLEQERQGFIANAGYQNAVTQQGYNQQAYVNNQQNAFQQYLRQSDPAYQQKYQAGAAQNYLNYQAPLNYQNRQYALADLADQRAYDLQNYQMQRNDYMNYLNSQKQSGIAGLLRGALAGAGAGYSSGNPWGALVGAGLGAAGGYYSTRY